MVREDLARGFQFQPAASLDLVQPASLLVIVVLPELAEIAFVEYPKSDDVAKDHTGVGKPFALYLDDEPIHIERDPPHSLAAISLGAGNQDALGNVHDWLSMAIARAASDCTPHGRQ